MKHVLTTGWNIVIEMQPKQDYKCPRYLKTFSSQTHLAHFSHWRQTTHKSPNPRETLHAGVDSEQDLTTFKYLGALSRQLQRLTQQCHSWFNRSDHLPLIPQIHSPSFSVALEIIFRLPAGLLLAQTDASSVTAESTEPDEISTPNLRSEIHVEFP